MSAGNSRHQPDYYLPNQRPKKLWLKELCSGARSLIAAQSLPNNRALGSLQGLIVTMALMGGARQISEIARFANRLEPKQRAELRLPIKKGTRRFYQVPNYSVFYQVLSRMDG